MKIELPNWVYVQLHKYHNLALPDIAKKYNRKSLEIHLAYKVGFDVKVREAIFKNFVNKKEIKEITYLIAEEKHL